MFLSVFFNVLIDVQFSGNPNKVDKKGLISYDNESRN